MAPRACSVLRRSAAWTRLALFFTVALLLPAVEAPVAASPLDDAWRAMVAGDTGAALDRLDDLDRGGKGSAAADVAAANGLLLQARALQQARRFDEAAEVFGRVRARFPQLPQSHKAAFGLAECHAAAGRFAEAEALFAEGLAGLDLAARQGELARLLLRLGRARLDPEGGRRQADPAGAETLLTEALALQPNGPLAEETVLLLARALLRGGKLAAAASRLAAFVEEHAGQGSPRRPELLYHTARATWKAGDAAGARGWLRMLLAEHPTAAPWAARASFLLSRTYGMPHPPDEARLARGQEALRRYLASFPEDSRAEQARLELALAPLSLGHPAEAEEALRGYLAAGGPQEQLAEARFQLGACLAAQGRWGEAADAYRNYLELHPAHARWSEARQGIEEMAWQQAEQAAAQQRWRDAAAAFQAFAESWPGAARAPQALLRQAGALAEAGETERALQVLATLTAKFPADPAAQDGWYETGLLLEERLQDFTKAREAYRKVQAGLHAGEAAARVEALDAPSLLVDAPRTFRSGEQPALSWATRNVEAVTIRAFRLQAEDFFRDRLSLAGVTAVDVALCTPDRTWTVKIDGYRRHARLRQRVPLPFDRPGLYLLNLSAGKLEATTAVRVSDLELIVKASPDQVFVLAQDARRLQPRAGVHVLVASAAKVLLEGTTGDDGTLVRALPPRGEAESDGLRFFAARDGHLAWADLAGGPGQPVASAASPRAFLFTDRPLYRPGDTVHLAGIVRDAATAIPGRLAGMRYTLAVQGPGDLTIAQSPAVLDEFGVFHQAVQLDSSAKPGHYSFVLRGPGGGAFSGSFNVAQTRRLPLSLTASFDRPVVFAGEPLGGTIRVRFPAGGPAAGQTVRWRLTGKDGWHQARTDDRGEVRFSLPSIGYEETQQVRLQVFLPRHEILQEARALVTVQESEASLGVAQRTLFAGQPFDVTVSITRPDGRPAAAQVVLEALQRLDGTGGERRVLRQELAVPETGELRTQLTLPAGGSHVLRLLGWDRGHNPVTAELALQVSGREEPGIQLDVDRPVQTVGTPAQVTIHSNLERALVLLTWEAERVLGHRTVLVKRGENRLELPITAELAPNVQLAAAAAAEGELYQVRRSLTVSRKLVLTIEPDRPEHEPGGEVALTVRAVDERGRPVDARLVLSVVDRSLLQAHPERLGDLLATFWVERPEDEVLTASSSTATFPEVEGSEVSQAGVKETEGSAALAALRSRRRVVTEQAAVGFAEITGRQAGVLGSLSVRGHGAGGGGLGARGAGLAQVQVSRGRRSSADETPAGARDYFPETAAFFHELRTDARGEAQVRFRLPDSITTWRVAARAVTRDTQLGEAEAELVARRDFWAELSLPPELEAGDRVQPLARLFNERDQPLVGQVTLQVAGEQEPRRATVRVPPHGLAEAALGSIAIPDRAAGGSLILELAASARPEAATAADGEAMPLPGSEELTDRLRRVVPVGFAGLAERVFASGWLEAPATTRLTRTLPLDAGLRHPRLEIGFSSRIEQFLLGQQFDALIFGNQPEQALLLLELLALLGPEAHPAMVAAARERLRQSLVHLVALQRPDGGWSPCGGERGPQALRATAAAVRALARSRVLAGKLSWPFPQAALDRAVSFLEEGLSGLPAEETVERTEVLYALAHLGKDRVPFVHLHRLHRLREELPLAAQALLGMTWQLLGRPEQAAEVAASLRPRLRFADRAPDRPGGGTPRPELGPRGAARDVDRLRGLALLGATSPPDDPLVAQGRAWLLGQGRSPGWWSLHEAEAATAALARLNPVGGRQGDRLRVRVRVNGQEAGTVELGGAGGDDAPRRGLAVDRALLRPGDNTLELQLEGQGRLFFLAELAGWPAEDLAASPPSTQPGSASAEPEAAGDRAADSPSPLRIARRVEPVPGSYRGREIAGGFTVAAAGSATWVSPVERLAAGTRAKVTLTLQSRSGAEGPHEGWVIEDRLPPGCELVEGSFSGPGAYLQREGRRLAVFVPAGWSGQEVSYVIAALHPGSYRFAPAQLLPLARPERLARGGGAALTIEPPGAELPPVRPTPDELYHLGLAAAEEHDAALALRSLEELMQTVTVREEIVDELLPVLLLAAIDVGDEPRIVEYFELAKEKDPALVIPFDKIGPVQRAYRALKSYEGGLHLGRGVADARFLAEVQAVGVLESAGELAEAASLLRGLLATYPDSPSAAAAAYAFAQVLYDHADQAEQDADDQDSPAGWDAPRLVDAAVSFLGGYLATFPDAPQAPAALFTLASALVERGRPEEAVAWGAVGLARYPGSEMAPAIAYVKAYAHFKLGQYGESLELCRRVAGRPDGEEDDDANRDMALYIMAQIHHARGELDRARELYGQVAGRFRDAAETLQELTREGLHLPEVVEVPPGELPAVEARLRSIRKLDLRAYSVDLLKLYLLEGSLDDLAGVNLAGIRPVLNRSLQPTARPGRSGTHTEELMLPLPGRGAYLVLARAGALLAHSLVLVEPLSCELATDEDGGRARLTVRDAAGRPVPGARVQIKGSEDDQFTAGRTDLRGIFLAEGLSGEITAIAEHRGAYGLYRQSAAHDTSELMLERSEGEEQSDAAQRPTPARKLYFGDDVIEGEFMRTEGGNVDGKSFFENAKKIKGMSVEQAK